MATIMLDPTRVRSLSRLSSSDVLRVARIKLSVVAVTGISLEELAGRRRTARIAGARMLAMALVREATNLSLVEVGQVFGDRDHGTVIHAVKTIASRCDHEAVFAASYSRLLAEAKA